MLKWCCAVRKIAAILSIAGDNINIAQPYLQQNCKVLCTCFGKDKSNSFMSTQILSEITVKPYKSGI